jgi:hypothetical protein
MIAEGWRVQAHCPTCFARARVDLVEVARKLGPEYSLWNRRAPCRRRTGDGGRCAGEVVFWAWPPGLHQGTALSEQGIVPRQPFAAGSTPPPPAG